MNPASPQEILQLLLNYGFPSVALVLVCFAGWKLLMDIIKHHNEHQDKLMSIIQNDLRGINEMEKLKIQALNDFRIYVSEGMKYQREEHARMIELLIDVKK